MRRSSQIDPYLQNPNMYALSQAGVPQMVQPSLIPAQVRHISPQSMDAYATQQYAQPRSSVSGLVGSQFNHLAPAYSGSMNGGNGYLGSSMGDPYQRTAYPYV